MQLGSLRLLIDPWLCGFEVDYFPWFNKQWHRTKPLELSKVPDFDAVLITQKYPDHFHTATLKQLQPKLIFAPYSIKKKIKLVLPKADIKFMGRENDLIEYCQIQIRFLETSRNIDPIYDAFVIDDGNKSVFLATHGFNPSNAQKELITHHSPCSLLFTPFNKYELPFFLGGTITPGMEAVKQLVQLLKPKKVIATHDEDKYAEGIVSKFANITWAPQSDELFNLSWLGKKYLEINHYDKIKLL
jgi:L-ascorbate metabolism protein UlaG (beta-lactamase superfamily)